MYTVPGFTGYYSLGFVFREVKQANISVRGSNKALSSSAYGTIRGKEIPSRSSVRSQYGIRGINVHVHTNCHEDYRHASLGTSDGKKEAFTAVEQLIDWNGKAG